MKFYFLYLLSFLLTFNKVETSIGIGLVKVDFDDKTVLNFYENKGDVNPIKRIEFFNDEKIQSWNIRDLKVHQQWLRPEVLWLNYYSFVFRCISDSNDWFEVLVNQDSGQTYWIKKQDILIFNTWEEYLKSMFSIARLSTEKQSIWESPSFNSQEIEYEGEDCFQVKSMKGEWIEIYTPSHCIDKNIIKKGWIRWRDNNKILVEYYSES
ncbi:hypothetical protein [Chondrinema litorale]|uniref:hypothetical protein n=1 Tax=Chondrinema litorale TaxID=2994555 RepID=UPI002542F8D3|nr:hypothetical protein [Chondrinema litorale]UZR97521.1 hypothetical protein OQ292_27320 [Chondrinema litorale]